MAAQTCSTAQLAGAQQKLQARNVAFSSARRQSRSSRQQLVCQAQKVAASATSHVACTPATKPLVSQRWFAFSPVPTACHPAQEANLLQHVGRNAAALGAAALMAFGGVSGPAVATEFDVINTSTPSLNYLIDDANVLNKTTKKSVNDRLYKLEVSRFIWVSQQC